MAFPPAQGSVPPYAVPTAATPSHSDLDGVGNLTVASLLGLLVQALIWIGVAIFDLLYSAISNSTVIAGTGGTTLPGWVSVNTLYIAVGLTAGGLVLGIVSYIFFYLGFRAIKRGAPDFGAPTTMVLVGLIGFLMIVLGLGIIIGTFVSAINSASSSGASLDLGALFGGIALIGLGGLLALVGVIGLVLGNWRAGTRYQETTIKVGGILTIIPYLSIVGYVLLVVGYMKAGSKLKSGWAPPAMAISAPMMTPGYPAPAPMPNAAWPAAPPTAPAAAPPPICPKCGQPATWVAQYNRWYCYTDQQYL
jgi:Protein of unknown function (DUF973)